MSNVATLLPLFLASREARNLRPQSLVNWRIWGRWTELHCGKMKITALAATEIKKQVQTKSRNHAQMTQCYLRWCMAERHLPRDHDVGVLPLPPRTDEAVICHWSPDEARRFLEAVRPVLRPVFILGLYAGLRPFECARIEWRDIHITDKRIRVEARVSKIRRARIIEGIPPILWRLLRPYARRNEARVMPGADTPEQAVFRIIYERRRAARVAEVPLGHDILRHTFATYYVALTGHPAMASKVLGHYKLHTLAAHYDGVATKAEAKDYFSARVTEVLT